MKFRKDTKKWARLRQHNRRTNTRELESFCLADVGSLEDLITELLCVKSRLCNIHRLSSKEIFLHDTSVYDDWPSYSWAVMEPESDEEVDKRIEQMMLQAEKYAKANQAKEDKDERKTYERLKKKFEKGD